MRSSLQEAGHRGRVAESGSGHATQQQNSENVATPTISSSTNTISSSTTNQPTNFEYDDNEWDVGIGDLIIDLDADIEKTNEVTGQSSSALMSTNAGPGGAQASKNQSTTKMHIEHSATADKGLKMKIKRTKPGSKSSEAKHEIVKSNEQNGNPEQSDVKDSIQPMLGKQGPISNNPSIGNVSSSGNNKRGSSGHRRDKIREKHGSSSSSSSSTSSSSSSCAPVFPPSNEKSNTNSNSKLVSNQTNINNISMSQNDVNGIVRISGSSRPVFPPSTGPGPPSLQSQPVSTSSSTSVTEPPSPSASTSAGQGATVKQESAVKGNAIASGEAQVLPSATLSENRSTSPPPKKQKTDNKEVSDVCIGTSIGTITEPDCLGPCEPGTSVTLEGIVWHETEGGVLVVNVTWRGKTYVGTLLDCTRHDWAPPRFCDSPTSDLDNRTPKGRETRSSVHSKLRNGGGIALKGRRGAPNGSGPSTAPSSPAPFVLPRPDSKRKNRVGEEETQSQQTSGNVPATGKKTKVVPPPAPATCSSPPPSPILLECPEPNCSKKYKHINGLKYHQSHAHGLGDDEDTKDITSTSENDESNIEAPSPATPVKSPEKSQDSPLTPLKKESEGPILLNNSNLLEIPSSQNVTPRSTPSPVTPQSLQEIPGVVARSPSVATPPTDKSNIVKPGVLRYTTSDDYCVFSSGGPITVQGTPSTNADQTTSTQSNSLPMPTSEQTRSDSQSTAQQLPSFSNQLSAQFNPPSSIIPPNQNNTPNPQSQNQLSPHPSPSPQSITTSSPSSKLTQFKVKPASALMPDDKKGQPNIKTPNLNKKKSRKSPTGSPHSPQNEEMMFDTEHSGGREEVQSPAYSDISDDGTPMVDSEIGEKNKNIDKKAETSQNIPHMPQYGMYHPFYSQTHQYLVQQSSQENINKELDSQEENISDKEQKKEGSEYPQKVLQHYYPPYGYMPTGYPYNIDSNYSEVPLIQDEKAKQADRIECPSPVEQPVKQPTALPNPIHVPTPPKSKIDTKDKHQNENHQILKESIEMKNQMSSYLYSRPQQNQQHQQTQQQNPQPQQHPQSQQPHPQAQQPHPQPQQPQQPPQSHHSQREEDMRRLYVYSEQKRKDMQSMPDSKSTGMSSSKNIMSQSQNTKPLKEIKTEDKKDKEVKQEGVKPTMETQGPPPPPTSQYAYIHPSYMQQAHYGALPFDPNHPMYRGIMVPSPYSGNPYIHAPIQRYHAPEDLSRAPPPSKALDMLQHHAQYYSSHKIHELQERAVKSPTPKTTMANLSPSTSCSVPSSVSQCAPQMSATTPSQPTNISSSGKQTPGDGKESRSPPPQRHVHTHHHTHVGLGYPMYPAPYGAAVLASQQAAAVTVINPYPTK